MGLVIFPSVHRTTQPQLDFGGSAAELEELSDKV